MAFQQYLVSPWLTSVRTVAFQNQSGVYFNGPVNNGVGATLTISASSLTIDGVVMAVGDRLLLQAQTNANQNGIYVVLSIGSTVVLQRAADQQSIEQLKAGQYVAVAAGTLFAGAFFTLDEPLPAQFGINNINFVQQSALNVSSFTVLGNINAGTSGTAGTVSSFPATAASGSLILAAVNNSAGNFNTTISNASSVGQSQVISIPDSGSATANFILSKSAGTQHITAGSLSVDAGNLLAGSSGNAGTVTSFPGTAANGSLILAAVNAGGAFNTTISNGTMGQSTVYTMGDIGAATGGLVVATAAVRMKSVNQAVVAGGAAAQTVTDTFCTSTSNVIANWNDTTNAVQIQKVAAGNGSFVVTSTADPGASHLNYIIIK